MLVRLLLFVLSFLFLLFLLFLFCVLLLILGAAFPVICAAIFCCFCGCFLGRRQLNPTLAALTFQNVNNNFAIDETPLTPENVKNNFLYPEKKFVSQKRLWCPKKSPLVFCIHPKRLLYQKKKHIPNGKSDVPVKQRGAWSKYSKIEGET